MIQNLMKPWFDPPGASYGLLQPVLHSLMPRRCFYTHQQIQNRISAPKPRKEDFESLLKKNLEKKIPNAKIEETC